ncbi:PucR family transcriptional regulator [Patulibacter defluvii]|uniref:PucR family transcriptional regulator n=1 Tax=Patulibacter defluvii TaxID=3095358 RepID=UPI002A74A9F2|nr:PucR family transcriptional regulator ligand-binding domain-containing protein [Patulibacter sp. DM4]
MPITVRELIAIPYLRTRVIAGAGGLDRAVAWAHSVEIHEPWEWLEPGDLVMTVGLGIPAPPEAQVRYVRELARIGASGVAIGEHMQAPELSPAMRDAAEEAELPLLMTAFEVPFVQMSRAVASANADAEHLRLVRAARIYDRVREAVVHKPGRALIDALADEVGAALWVCAPEDPTLAPLTGAPQLPAPLAAAFLGLTEGRRDELPGVLRGSLEDGATMLVIPVPTARSASLVVVSRQREPPSYALLQHVATAVALELERSWARREEARRLGSEALAQLIERRLDGDEARRQLERQGLTVPLRVGLLERDGGMGESGWLHHALADRRIPNMLLRREGRVHCLLPADDATVDRFAPVLPAGMRMGLSDPVAALREIPAAVTQARWALDAAADSAGGIARYGDRRSEFGPRSVEEAQLAVDRVLGPLLDYREGDLVRTLEVFLRHNRSWLRASEELFVHKQTLVHRIRRIEQLTGRRLSETADVSELWLAVEAWRRLPPPARTA